MNEIYITPTVEIITLESEQCVLSGSSPELEPGVDF
jgi:hypothetical protein